jgi:tetratricopeptide (TPR) repeat protein
MKKQIATILLTLLLSTTLLRAADETTQQLEKAYSEMGIIMPTAQQLVVDGHADEANQKLLAVFPESTRTPVQSLLLGNLLFHQDPKQSYTLHKAAAIGLPREYDAQLEWALEQHRAGEYIGAADGYSTASKIDPNNALLYGLWAECLIRQGETDQAVKTWEESEKAPNGTLEDLEAMVCEVHMHATPDMDRTALMKKTRAGDIESAAKLIQLDANFPRDWWNTGPNAKYLAVDLSLLKSTKFADVQRVNELACAAECGVALASEDAQDVKSILTKHGYLFDPAVTLPGDGWTASVMLAVATEKGAITPDAARDKWLPQISARVQKSTDAEYWNVAANLSGSGTDQLLEIDQQGWDRTGDVRFAGSLLAGLDARGRLKAGDPILVKALKQFPESSVIAAFEVRATLSAGLPARDVLVHAIKTEYTKMSPGGLLSLRPSAGALQAYFKLLAEGK